MGMSLPTDWKYLVDKVTHTLHSLDFFIMSTKLLALAAELVDTNPAGSQLIVSLTNAETATEIVEALDAYDVAVAEVNTPQPTLEPVAF